MYMEVTTSKAPLRRGGGEGEAVEEVLLLHRSAGQRAVVIELLFVLLALVAFACWPSQLLWERVLPAAVVLWASYLFWEDNQDIALSKRAIVVHRTSLHARVLGLTTRRNVYSSDVNRVYVHSERLRYFGVGRQVIIELADGIEVPLTGHCTFDREAEHLKVAEAVADYYRLPDRPTVIPVQ
jgi:hypothetical protein